MPPKAKDLGHRLANVVGFFNDKNIMRAGRTAQEFQFAEPVSKNLDKDVLIISSSVHDT